ncbi:MAG: ester cyclase [Verrucomicrobia bacterium]|nr:ester cyclase [Verrucomicrobiota bacterium]
MKRRSAVIREFIERVLNQGDIEATTNYFWPDVVEEVPLPGQGPGLAGLKEVLRGLRTSFPDLKWVVEEQIEEGDTVVTRFTWTGTHKGPFLGISPTGRFVSVWGMVIDHFRGEKVASTRIIMDSLGLVTQLREA